MTTTDITCVIIDDEESGRIVLRELILKLCPEIKIVGEASNIEDGFSEISIKKPFFIFLDIHMPKGNGFALLRKFKTIPFKIIFTTSYEQYAINAIKYSALDYLLKPIDISEFKASILKVKKLKEDMINTQPLVMNFLNNIDESHLEKNIVVHHQDKVKFVKLSDVISFEAESNYTHIYLSNGEHYTPAKVLKEFEEYLIDYKNFIRINKSTIINLDYMTEYSKGEPCFIYMKNGKEYEIGRRKKTEVAERMKK